LGGSPQPAQEKIYEILIGKGELAGFPVQGLAPHLVQVFIVKEGGLDHVFYITQWATERQIPISI